MSRWFSEVILSCTINIWDKTAKTVAGVLLFLVASLGLVGNVTSFVILLRQKVQKTFHNLLFLLSTFDTVVRFFTIIMINYSNYYFQIYLLSAVILFTLPNVKTGMSLALHQNAMPYILPVAHIGMVGSMFTTVAISLERYLAVVYPFAKFRSSFIYI